MMLKGAHKQMIVVRTHNSRLFEEAYFVMRRGVDRYSRAGREGEADMLWEANRIIESAQPTEVRHRPNVSAPGFGMGRGLVWFALGLISGSGIVGVLWWLL